MSDLIPISFFGYDSIIYLVSAIIGFLIAYKAYRLYNLTSKKSHFYLFIAFTIFSIGLITISLTSAFTYVKYFMLGELKVFDPQFGIDDLGFWIYFGSSFIAYLFLVFMHTTDKKKMWISLPISFNYYSYFNVVLFFLIAYVAFKSAVNFFSRKTTNSFLVMSSFVLIGVYHGALLFTAFSKLAYAIAHISLIAGFLALLWMLIRVSRK